MCSSGDRIRNRTGCFGQHSSLPRRGRCRTAAPRTSAHRAGHSGSAEACRHGHRRDSKAHRHALVELRNDHVIFRYPTEMREMAPLPNGAWREKDSAAVTEKALRAMTGDIAVRFIGRRGVARALPPAPYPCPAARGLPPTSPAPRTAVWGKDNGKMPPGLPADITGSPKRRHTLHSRCFRAKMPVQEGERRRVKLQGTKKIRRTTRTNPLLYKSASRLMVQIN